MKLNSKQVISLAGALRDSGKHLTFIARKYGLNYGLLCSWAKGNTAALKNNQYGLFLTAIKTEIGWCPQEEA